MGLYNIEAQIAALQAQVGMMVVDDFADEVEGIVDEVSYELGNAHDAVHTTA